MTSTSAAAQPRWDTFQISERYYHHNIQSEKGGVYKNADQFVFASVC